MPAVGNLQIIRSLFTELTATQTVYIKPKTAEDSNQIEIIAAPKLLNQDETVYLGFQFDAKAKGLQNPAKIYACLEGFHPDYRIVGFRFTRDQGSFLVAEFTKVPAHTLLKQLLLSLSNPETSFYFVTPPILLILFNKEKYSIEDLKKNGFGILLQLANEHMPELFQVLLKIALSLKKEFESIVKLNNVIAKCANQFAGKRDPKIIYERFLATVALCRDLADKGCEFYIKTNSNPTRFIKLADIAQVTNSKLLQTVALAEAGKDNLYLGFDAKAADSLVRYVKGHYADHVEVGSNSFKKLYMIDKSYTREILVNIFFASMHLLGISGFNNKILSLAQTFERFKYKLANQLDASISTNFMFDFFRDRNSALQLEKYFVGDRAEALQINWQLLKKAAEEAVLKPKLFLAPIPQPINIKPYELHHAFLSMIISIHPSSAREFSLIHMDDVTKEFESHTINQKIHEEFVGLFDGANKELNQRTHGIWVLEKLTHESNARALIEYLTKNHKIETYTYKVKEQSYVLLTLAEKVASFTDIFKVIIDGWMLGLKSNTYEKIVFPIPQWLSLFLKQKLAEDPLRRLETIFPLFTECSHLASFLKWLNYPNASPVVQQRESIKKSLFELYQFNQNLLPTKPNGTQLDLGSIH